MEWGFGSPSSFADDTGEAKPAAPASAYFDHGFGTPALTQLDGATAVALTTETFDTGFGSPYNTPYEIIAEVYKPDTGRFKLNGISMPFPDNGGIAVFLKGEIPYSVVNMADPNNENVTLVVVAPVKIRIFGANNTFYDLQGKPVVSESNAPYVNGTDPGVGTNLEPLFRIRGNPAIAQAVRFVLPPLPPGAYGLKIYSGVTGGVVSKLAQAFRVVRRNRANSAYRMRSNVPELFKVGPISVDGEDFWTGGVS